MAWLEHTKQCAAGNHVASQESAREAARRYSRAARLRPKVAFLSVDGVGRRRLIQRFPPAVVLHANARDAYRDSGRRLRQAWYSGRSRGLRRRRRGKRALLRGDYRMAYAWFDWGVVTADGAYIDEFDESLKSQRDYALAKATRGS